MIPTRPKLPANTPSQYLATIAAEITGECAGPGRETVRHRVWIHRDGSVTVPDHDHDSDAEQVARALGDDEINFCQYWLRLNDSTGRSGKHMTGEPHRTAPGWEMTYESFWTPKSEWTALAGILNSITFMPMNPGWALAYAQTYLEKSGRLPDRPADHLSNLATPWARQQGGFRRRSMVPPEELAALLDAGVPTDHAAVFAVLDVAPATAKRAISKLKSWGHPPDLFIRMCYALPAEKSISVLEGLSDERGRRLPSLLGTLQTAIDNNPHWVETDVEQFILGRAE